MVRYNWVEEGAVCHQEMHLAEKAAEAAAEMAAQEIVLETGWA